MTPQTKNCKGCNYERKYNEPWEFHTCGKEQTKNTNKKCLNPTLCGQAGVSGSNFSRTWICDRCSSKNTKAVEGWRKHNWYQFFLEKVSEQDRKDLEDFIQTELDRAKEEAKLEYRAWWFDRINSLTKGKG